MSEKKIVVPDGMLRAALGAVWIGADKDVIYAPLEAALRWLSENPIVPTPSQVQEMFGWPAWGKTQRIAVEWQRRMFLAPEPEVPEEIKGLLWSIDTHAHSEDHNDAVVEAFRRGKLSR